MNQTYRLLALCARAGGHPAFYEQLKHQVDLFTAWDDLPTQAEIHGMAPLLWHHTRQAGVSIPHKTERGLRGLYLRHRALNLAQANVLVDVQNLFVEKGIQALVLKGLALAYTYYPDPALRPVSDIDLLLKQDDVLPALNVLAEAGYRVRIPDPNLRVLPNELTADSPMHDGLTIHVELHHYHPKHRLLNDLMHDTELENFNDPPQVLAINGHFVYTPSWTDTLHYLMRHMVRHLFLARKDKPLPLKWSADILSLVENHAEEINWVTIQQSDPGFLNRLAVMYSLTPLPEKYKKLIPVEKSDTPTGVNQYPVGWPQHAFPEWKRVGFWRFVKRTFQAPAAWWLRMYYGIEEYQVSRYGSIVYRLRVLRLIFWAILRRTLFKGI